MAITDGVTVPEVDSEGNTKTVKFPTPGSEKNFYAPNMCDPCCWYPDSTRVDNEELDDDGDHITYHSDHANWIDLTHGRVFKEDQILAENADYLVKVEVQVGGVGDWVEKTENTWNSDPPDGDYSVDYETGDVIFNSALGATDKVRASYSYATTYTFYVEPTAGKMLKVVYAEVQYMKDIRFNTNVNFAIEAYNPAPPPTRVPIHAYTFKRLRNFYEESIGPFPVIPHHGGESEVIEVTGIANIQAKKDEGYDIEGSYYDETADEWTALMHGIKANGGRAMRHAIMTVPFHYTAFVPLYSTMGMRIKITLDAATPFGGSFANITFYCMSEDDPNA
jgi:hypothetical protein